MTPEQIQQAWCGGRILPLAGPAPHDRQALREAIGPSGLGRLESRWGPGVVVGSGGSSGADGSGRRWCLQPLAHLEASAAATGAWLQNRGFDPAACVHLNGLPLHHVSGLLPLVRCRQWGALHLRLDPTVMREPARLAELPLPPGRPLLLALVPTQLQRLLAQPEGLAWLQRLAVVWVGGAPLGAELAERARRAGLRLAPCYGATETAAMVCALPPERFLAGDGGCGPALGDVRVRIAPGTGAVELACGRLSPGWLVAGELQPLPRAADGWWRSGDAGRLLPAGLQVLGRLDGALHSGGETVFPEQLEQRLLLAAGREDLPLRWVLLLARDDPQWGQRLEALVCPVAGACGASQESLLLSRLAGICAPWAPAERPRRWHLCPELAPSPLGKWQRGRWQAWLDRLEAGHVDDHHHADEQLQR
ncbi:MAG: AMP-binding protein [Cyanobium sp.]